MAISPVFESIKLNKKQAELKDQVKVLSTLSLLSDDVRKILSCSAFSVITDKTVLNGKVKYGGRVNFFISYLSTSGKIEKIESATEFLGELAFGDLLEDDDVRILTKTEKVSADLTGTKVTACAYIGVAATVFSNATVSVLSGGDNLIIDSKVSLTAFVDYCNATEESDKAFALKRHLHSLRAHCKELQKKNYSSAFQKHTISITICCCLS
jgi:hypothetical protein